MSLMAGGGEDASPLTGDPVTVSTLPEAGTIVQHTLEKFLRSNITHTAAQMPLNSSFLTDLTI